MKCLIFICFTFVLTILSIGANANVSLPSRPPVEERKPDVWPLACVQCIGDYEPVCATPTENNARGGKARTFHNVCLVEAADCGFMEKRKFR